MMRSHDSSSTRWKNREVGIGKSDRDVPLLRERWFRIVVWSLFCVAVVIVTAGFMPTDCIFGRGWYYTPAAYQSWTPPLPNYALCHAIERLIAVEIFAILALALAVERRIKSVSSPVDKDNQAVPH